MSSVFGHDAEKVDFRAQKASKMHQNEVQKREKREKKTMPKKHAFYKPVMNRNGKCVNIRNASKN